MNPNQSIKQKLSEQSFQNWTKEDLFIYLQVMQLSSHPLLTAWINRATKTVEMTKLEQDYLQELQETFAPFMDTWNEATLRYNFISPVVSLVRFVSRKYQFSNFSEASLKASYKGIILKGRVEWLAALGLQKPRTPFFFIHEYKPTVGSLGDVAGQLVAAMVAAQAKNQLPRTPNAFNPNPKSFADEPIYGCYILGRNWYFVVLKGAEYAISSAYDATQWSDLQLIFKIFKAEKQRIIQLLEEEPIFPMMGGM